LLSDTIDGDVEFISEADTMLLVHSTSELAAFMYHVVFEHPTSPPGTHCVHVYQMSEGVYFFARTDKQMTACEDRQLICRFYTDTPLLAVKLVTNLLKAKRERTWVFSDVTSDEMYATIASKFELCK
jgi:hypothetical protein